MNPVQLHQRASLSDNVAICQHCNDPLFISDAFVHVGKLYHPPCAIEFLSSTLLSVESQAREVVAWFRSGNRIPIEPSSIVKKEKFLNDVAKLEAMLFTDKRG